MQTMPNKRKNFSARDMPKVSSPIIGFVSSWKQEGTGQVLPLAMPPSTPRHSKYCFTFLILYEVRSNHPHKMAKMATNITMSTRYLCFNWTVSFFCDRQQPQTAASSSASIPVNVLRSSKCDASGSATLSRWNGVESSSSYSVLLPLGCKNRYSTHAGVLMQHSRRARLMNPSKVKTKTSCRIPGSSMDLPRPGKSLTRSILVDMGGPCMTTTSSNTIPSILLFSSPMRTPGDALGLLITTLRSVMLRNLEDLTALHLLNGTSGQQSEHGSAWHGLLSMACWAGPIQTPHCSGLSMVTF
mmetsp:Transcript_8074/g.21855  ORF Transcript_8074/g.21855 Transcript_8074/m.21855 type:complete len:299 (-) Transcript_8074:1008-1904(-)